MIIPHDLKCGVCGATATHEQCGGLLACDAHIGPGRAWLIDAKTIELHDGATVAERLRDVLTRTVEGLTVHGVGIGADALIVYCYGRPAARRRMPTEFGGHAVKYVICKVMPGGAQ